jgi:hypothetical protein
MPAVFISHSHRDAALADQFRAYLIASGVPKRELLVSSRPEQGFESGVFLSYAIQQALREAVVFVGLVTPSFYRSVFCMGELAAFQASAAERHKLVAPFLVPPVTRREGFLDGVLSYRLDRDSLKDRVALNDAVRRVRERLNDANIEPTAETLAAQESAAQQMARIIPPDVPVLREVADVRYRSCYPSTDRTLVRLPGSVADELEATQWAEPPAYRHRRFPWEKTVQVSALDHVAGRLVGLKLVIAMGRVTPANCGLPFVHTSMARSHSGAPAGMKIIPHVFAEAGAGISERPGEGTWLETTVGPRSAVDARPPLRVSTWSALPGEYGLTTGEAAYMATISTYDEPLEQERWQDFWVLDAHRCMAVDGRTAYLFLDGEQVEFVRELFTLPFDQPPGFSLVEHQTLAPRIGGDSFDLTAWAWFEPFVPFLDRVRSLDPFPKDPRLCAILDRLRTVDRRGARVFSFWVDARIDPEDVIDRRLLVFCGSRPVRPLVCSAELCGGAARERG